MIDNIFWLGHASFKIVTDKIIYIDPYKIKKGEPADIILITHDHFDHFSKSDITKLSKKETVCVAPPSVADQLSGNVAPISRGETKEIKGITIEAVPAYNIGKSFHPKESDNVGLIVTVEGTRIYHAGDTDCIPEMNSIKADIVLLPCGGTYTMNAKEAAEAVKRINPKVAIPMHWGGIVGTREDAEKFKALCHCEVKILDSVN